MNRGLDEVDADRIASILATQKMQALETLSGEAGEVVRTEILHSADMQFRGQTHLIRVPLGNATPTRAAIQAAFEAAYFARFQVRLPEIRAVLVNLNTSVIGRRRPFALSALLDPAEWSKDARIGTRPLYAEGAWHDAAVWQRERLAPGTMIPGPAILQQADATTVLEPGCTAIVDGTGNLRISA
ncbi:hypothetical protein ACE7GA_11075 [Roseomonas sp. CCTCC AB2023176]|uniref:hypothetical protein n=1 Tax=Roseomonas sp. CCTCC AB2023176 TaxID=3342640 RepID=UPI0035D6BEC4